MEREKISFLKIVRTVKVYKRCWDSKNSFLKIRPILPKMGTVVTKRIGEKKYCKKRCSNDILYTSKVERAHKDSFSFH